MLTRARRRAAPPRPRRPSQLSPPRRRREPSQLRRCDGVLRDWDASMEANALAARYSVSRAWVHQLQQRRRETGSIAPRRQTRWRTPGLTLHLAKLEDHRDPCSSWPESAFMMTGIGVHHRSESVFTFNRRTRLAHPGRSHGSVGEDRSFKSAGKPERHPLRSECGSTLPRSGLVRWGSRTLTGETTSAPRALVPA